MISRLPPACRSPQGEKKKKLMISETKQGPSTAGRAGTDDGNNSKDAATSSMPLPAISSGTSSGGRAYADFKIGFRDDMNRKCRKSMEDAHSYHLDFPVENAGFFAIFDGHAGKNAAQW
eukprot:Partr_v1_DN25501_c0_g1_i1_m20479 putative phosphatase 2C